MATKRFLEKLVGSLANGSFVRLVLSGEPKITARQVELKRGTCLSLTFHHATHDTTKNLPVAEAVAWLEQYLAGGHRSAFLATTRRDWQLTPKGLLPHKPSVTTPPPRAHDRVKQTFLDESARDWLEALGLSRPAMADKRRQIHRYLEILSHLANDCGWNGEHSLTLADMGCGKGYLTFGAWHLFCRLQHWPVRIIGVEARPELVEKTNRIAQQIGARELEFVVGTIRSVALPPLDALIALHACDTATDDAIRRGIESKADLIVVAPCCHKQVRPHLAPPEPLAPVLKHGIMAERLAEWVTDGLRALRLEAAGYRTKIIEFVSSEHTPKNLMIAGVRADRARSLSAEAIRRLEAFFGVRHDALD